MARNAWSVDFGFMVCVCLVEDLETLRFRTMRDHESLRFSFEFFYRRFKAR